MRAAFPPRTAPAAAGGCAVSTARTRSSQAWYRVARVITGQSLPYRHRPGPNMSRASRSTKAMADSPVPGAASVASPESLHTMLSLRASRRIACRHVEVVKDDGGLRAGRSQFGQFGELMCAHARVEGEPGAAE